MKTQIQGLRSFYTTLLPSMTCAGLMKPHGNPITQEWYDVVALARKIRSDRTIVLVCLKDVGFLWVDEREIRFVPRPKSVREMKNAERFFGGITQP